MSDIANVDTSGCAAPAVLRFNEVNANISGGCDLIELRVIQGGQLDGYHLMERTDPLVVLPPITVNTNDYIVLHLNGNSTNCSPGGAVAEYISPSGLPRATYGTTYDTAWDFYLADQNLTFTDNVLTMFGNDSAIVDAVLLSDALTGSAAADSETQAELVRAAGQWLKADGTAATSGFFVDDNFSANAVQGLGSTGTSASGDSIQRIDDDDTNKMGDWTSANEAPTWGANNAGQSNL
ncbi:MAG: hypothetical protein ABIJ09_02465 [Pseudomonadota bacterium]